MEKCRIEYLDGKIQMAKCGWKNADERMRMTIWE